jgi:biopolymer transport protein ExbD
MSGKSTGFVRRDALHRWSLQFGPNMTPMVDIVLVILIFFMAVAAFIGEEWFLNAGIAPESSRSGAGPLSEQLKLDAWRIDLLLGVDARGNTTCSSTALRVDNESVSRAVEMLAGELKAHQGDDIEVVIISEFAVPYQDVIRVHEACTAAGAEKVMMHVGQEASG